MASLVYLTTLSPSKLGAELEQAGHRVWEALAVSEVLYLIEHEDIDIVVIAPEVDDAALITKQVRRPCITLEHGFSPAQLIWEIAALSPGTSSTVQ